MMSMNDPLSTALSKMLNSERIGRKECTIKPVSTLIKKVFKIMNAHKYIGAFKETNDGKGGFIVINLLGNINKCGSVKPRFSCKVEEFTKFEKRYLLARGFGILLISTQQGLMTHDEAKKKNIGGKLIAYCY